MTSPFAFLQPEWPTVCEAADKAAAAAYPDPRTACFYARRALELAVAWSYKSDASLRLPYQDSLSALIHEPSFKAAAGEAVFKEESHGLGLFVRSLVGLDREATKHAFAGFLAGKTLDANQIEFVNLIVNHLTEHGVMAASLLYESPFTDLTPRGPDVFAPAQLDELLAILDQVRAAAVAA